MALLCTFRTDHRPTPVIAAVPDVAELEPIAAWAGRRIHAAIDDLAAG